MENRQLTISELKDNTDWCTVNPLYPNKYSDSIQDMIEEAYLLVGYDYSEKNIQDISDKYKSLIVCKKEYLTINRKDIPALIDDYITTYTKFKANQYKFEDLKFIEDGIKKFNQSQCQLCLSLQYL